MGIFLLIPIGIFLAYSVGRGTESYTRRVANARRHRRAYWQSMGYDFQKGLFTALAILAILAGVALAAASCCPVGSRVVASPKPVVGSCTFCVREWQSDGGPQ